MRENIQPDASEVKCEKKKHKWPLLSAQKNAASAKRGKNKLWLLTAEKHATGAKRGKNE